MAATNAIIDDVKVWWESNTVKGAFLALASLLAGVLFKGQIPVDGQSVYDAVLNLLTAVGSVWAIIGRFTASSALVASTQQVTAARARVAAAAVAK